MEPYSEPLGLRGWILGLFFIFVLAPAALCSIALAFAAIVWVLNAIGIVNTY